MSDLLDHEKEDYALWISNRADSSLIVKIAMDGTVVLGENISKEQAAVEFWKAVAGVSASVVREADQT